ncbi:BQ2448_4779 [Microbotryum intermedium]|uniref:BQ2448_4779 protein n=1 Tax=Microbotryum intermedium TaxID=269621 RepID=A0A238FFW3_9BASI|nr:BQ2448_4779 [Microbotryum intermedium]
MGRPTRRQGGPTAARGNAPPRKPPPTHRRIASASRPHPSRRDDRRSRSTTSSTAHRERPTTNSATSRTSNPAPRRARNALEPLAGNAHWSCEANDKGLCATCCFKGKVHLPKSPRPPEDYRVQLDRTRSRYDHGLAFTSLGGKLKPHQASEQ